MRFDDLETSKSISASTLHRTELGDQNVTIDTLEQIMDRLKVSMWEIF